MARKISITKEQIREAAFEITRKEGSINLTARRLATEAGCSTQPIFRVYENMDSLNKDVFDMAMESFSDFQAKNNEQNMYKPFVGFGLAYILFAMEEPQLFRTLFLSTEKYGKSLYELLNGKSGFFMKEMNRAKSLGVKSPDVLFMKMWIFIHGAACMAITGDYDLSGEETIKLLDEMYDKNAD